jgi:hypothetical protein
MDWQIIGSGFSHVRWSCACQASAIAARPAFDTRIRTSPSFDGRSLFCPREQLAPETSVDFDEMVRGATVPCATRVPERAPTYRGMTSEPDQLFARVDLAQYLSRDKRERGWVQPSARNERWARTRPGVRPSLVRPIHLARSSDSSAGPTIGVSLLTWSSPRGPSRSDRTPAGSVRSPGHRAAFHRASLSGDTGSAASLPRADQHVPR